MKRVKNEHTGREEIQFGATLISISDKVLENSNKKKYKVATIEFENVDGKTVRSTALVYEGNYSKGLEIDQTYLAVATPMDDGAVIIQMSHLVYGGDIPTADMFGFDVVQEVDPVTQPNTEFE